VSLVYIEIISTMRGMYIKNMKIKMKEKKNQKTVSTTHNHKSAPVNCCNSYIYDNRTYKLKDTAKQKKIKRAHLL